MKYATVAHSTVSRAVDHRVLPPLPPRFPPPPLSSPALQGLMEATSNFGIGPAANGATTCADWARMSGALKKPIATGTVREVTTAAAKLTFFGKIIAFINLPVR
jgi:hypothetical protein